MFKAKEPKKISSIIRRWLLAVMLITITASLIGFVVAQTLYQQHFSYTITETYIRDVATSVDKDFNKDLKTYVDSVKGRIESDIDNYGEEFISNKYLSVLVDLFSFFMDEINFIDENGIIVHSSNPEYVGFDMNSGEQSNKFNCLLEGQSYYQQDLRASTYDPNLKKVYAGMPFSNYPGYFQVGVSEEKFNNLVNEALADSTMHRHIGMTGVILICDKSLTVLGSTDNALNGIVVENTDILATKEGEYKRTETTIEGERVYTVATISKGYHIIGLYPVSEAKIGASIDKILTIIVIILVVFLVMISLSMLMKKLVVDGVKDINSSLAKITAGDLDERANVSSSLEFIELSGGINATVDRLKALIKEADARIDKELEMARLIQRNSLPELTDTFTLDNKFFSLYATMDTAKTVGGDFYDFYYLPGNILAITIADVSDKGVPAAMFMMKAKTLFKSRAAEGLSLEELVASVNNSLCANNEANMFVTVWIAFIDLTTGVMKYIHAGHTCPVLCRDQETMFLRENRQLLIGAWPDRNYTTTELTLRPGDTLYLYTDGVTEAFSATGEEFGNDRLVASLNKAKEKYKEDGSMRYSEYICREVLADVREFTDDTAQSDDITMLCLHYTGADSDAL